MDMIWFGCQGITFNGTLYAQMYPTCAQIEVESDSSLEALPKGIRIPEDMSQESPGKVPQALSSIQLPQLAN
jgi:hypothetical protein